MSISYELAKELKDAGFSQFTFDVLKPLGGKTKYFINAREVSPSQSTISESVYFPTLSELIEACGDGFSSLFHATPEIWEVNAFQFSERKPTMYGRGPTPEEAVARLWLALHKK